MPDFTIKPFEEDTGNDLPNFFLRILPLVPAEQRASNFEKREAEIGRSVFTDGDLFRLPMVAVAFGERHMRGHAG